MSVAASSCFEDCWLRKARLGYDCAYVRWRETHKLLVVVFNEKISLSSLKSK